MKQPTPTPAQVPSVATGEGLSIGQALIAAGADISEAHALSSNRDQRMITRYGVKARQWLESLGWQQQSRKWYRPNA